jgi:hypothetical protein
MGVTRRMCSMAEMMSDEDALKGWRLVPVARLPTLDLMNPHFDFAR